ncbi:hypothetical protein TRFO_38638 [Tritrichomonas foetus]|uniref:DUF1963 domain-containing protein n=1 Tax=Tritrichomonas foetus TaxID=1144522 RepID=A0A1J4J8V5_9EUKA|nr:hypothetical protein TRFO_38638 [Tritrichomonas foetus]|eukprot:OHS95121.1 hypothetical protein TRFO_38638 [Tritrichomonas foetus]
MIQMNQIHNIFTYPISDESIGILNDVLNGPPTEYNYFSLFRFYSTRFKDNAEIALKVTQSIREIHPEFLSIYIRTIVKKGVYDSYETKSDDISIVFPELLNHEFITLEQIAEVINSGNATDNEADDDGPKDLLNNIDIKVIPKLFERYPKLNELCPNVASNLIEHQKIIKEILSDETIVLPYASPIVVIGDSCNPRISKFGGHIPHLPHEPKPLCNDCHGEYSMICQIYVPSTPQFFQNYFPPNRRDALILYFYCNNCYLNVKGKIYYGDDLDNLVYEYDKNFGYGTFNEPRIVTGWSEGLMAPMRSNDIVREIERKYCCSQISCDLAEFNDQFGPKPRTYIGGWPDFVQSDTTPDNSVFLINFCESEASTAMWGDCGTAQLWIGKGKDFDALYADWACC